MNIEVTIDVSEETHARLERQATAEGRTVREIVSDQVAGSVGETPTVPPAQEASTEPSLAEKRAAYERIVQLRETLTPPTDEAPAKPTIAEKQAALKRLRATIDRLPPLPTDKTDKELLYDYIDEKYG